MKTTKNGYRINRNGKPILSIESNAIVRQHKESVIKEDGTYYYFNRKQGDLYIYLP